MALDRSKYRNPAMPVGCIKTEPEPELQYKEGIEIDGVHYIWAPYIYEMHLEEREDYAELSDLGFMSDSDEDIADNKESKVENTETEVSDTTDIPSTNIQMIKEDIIIKQESNEKSNDEEKVPKHNKDQDSDNTSTLDTSFSHMDIDSEKTDQKKKIKKSKKEHKSDYRSNSSSPSTSHKHNSSYSRKRHSSSSHKHHSPSRHRHRSLSDERHSKIVTYSPSPSSSPEQYNNINIKEEPSEQPEHLFGCYHCDVCNITMNSLLTYNTHVNGKRHRKNMKVKNVSEVVAQSIPATVISEDLSKYPEPPRGIIRRKVQTPASIQHVLETNLKTPCPSLDYVTEIRGIGEVQYYCSLCDAVCSPDCITSHLRGFKHQLRSLKHFKPGIYEDIQHEPKYRIENQLTSILHAVQKKKGMGRVRVEVDELISDSKNIPHSMKHQSTCKDYQSQPSTSTGINKEFSGIPFHERYDQATIPDMSASDFSCKICQSHMNSLQMWESHIRGKRHLTNLKKNPGAMPSKTKTVLVPGKKAFLLSRIKKQCPNEPIVGLKEVRETEILETNSHSYQCFLCGSCHTSLDILDHLISLKHRTKYLDHINFPGREVIAGMSDVTAYSLVKEMCAQVESEEGCGKPAVHVNKSSLFH